ncbi:MAG TPA: hypothetical protein ENI92_00645 [Bacteroidetes bacterium]|nr:hypothetical protein [Bacteroidota bacterium]
MDKWIALAKGPLFAVCFLFMVMGLGRHLALQLDCLFRRKGRRLKEVQWRSILQDSLGWVLPVRHIIQTSSLFSGASYLMHFGLILVPLFLADHIVLWERFLGVGLPSLGRMAADILTLLTIACLLVLLFIRTFVAEHRAISRTSDYLLLIALLLPFVSGFLAAHPVLNPLRYQVMFLVHILSAELLFILVPTTKLAHIVLYFFDRISQVHWQLRPGAGDKVAEAIYGKGARV